MEGQQFRVEFMCRRLLGQVLLIELGAKDLAETIVNSKPHVYVVGHPKEWKRAAGLVIRGFRTHL